MFDAGAPEIKVSKHKRHGEDGHSGGHPVAVNIVVVGIGEPRDVGLQVVDEVVAELFEVSLGSVAEHGVGIVEREHGIHHQGNVRSVDLSKLEVDPCTDGTNGTVFCLEDTEVIGRHGGCIVAAFAQGRICIGQVVVAVVDDSIVIAGIVVCVVVGDRKGGDVLQVCISIVVDNDEITS